MSITITSIGKKLLAKLPSPIAVNWGLLVRATSDSEKVRLSWAVLDSFLRYSSGVLLASYLRDGQKVDAVERLIPNLERPSLGHYCGLIREILRPIKNQEDHFLFEIHKWYYTPKGKPSEMALLLDKILNERNKDAHKIIRTEKELQHEAQGLYQELQTLMHRAKWLSGYRLFRVENPQNQRRGGQRGNILFYEGDVKTPLPILGGWSCNLFPESIYLGHPNGHRFLEVNPFMIVESHGRQESLFLWVSTPKGKRIDMRCDGDRRELKRLPLIFDETVQWSDWLSRREELEPITDNDQVSDFAAEDYKEIGMLINERYRVIERLGEGGMGVVFHVEDEVMDEELALKVLHFEQVDSSVRERTKAEFRFMKSLKHPNILPVQSLTMLNDGRVAISMPLMRGNLKDILDQSASIQERIEHWASGILSALNYLHNQESPIYHRDIKPSNFLLNDEGEIFLADFGIARQDGDVRLTNTKEHIGSIPYMAPEMAQGGPANAATDRYALGIALHEIYTGALPRTNQIGDGIEGLFQSFVRQLCSLNPAERMLAQWPNFEVPASINNDDIIIDVNSNKEDILELRTNFNIPKNQPVATHANLNSSKNKSDDNIDNNQYGIDTSFKNIEEKIFKKLISANTLEDFTADYINILERKPKNNTITELETKEARNFVLELNEYANSTYFFRKLMGGLPLEDIRNELNDNDLIFKVLGNFNENQLLNLKNHLLTILKYQENQHQFQTMIMFCIFISIPIVFFQVQWINEASRAESHKKNIQNLYKTTNIPAKPFRMGCSIGDKYCEEDESPSHQVTLKAPITMMTSEVTQELYIAVTQSNPSYFEGQNLPVDSVSWYDSVNFANKLSSIEGLEECYTIKDTNVEWINKDCTGWRLPTEAEWEFTAKYKFHGTDESIDNFAWYNENSRENGVNRTHAVCTKKSNHFGLCDIHGNVREWTWDKWGPYTEVNKINPTGVESGLLFVLRGGSWDDSVVELRPTNREADHPDIKSKKNGFRLVRYTVSSAKQRSKFDEMLNQ